MKKMYVLVRKDLDCAYSAVQAGHALAQYIIDFPKNIGIHEDEWLNGILIYLGINNEKELNHWIELLDQQDIEYSFFREPDIGDQCTALAAFDYPDHRLETLFKDLSLL